MTAMEEKSGETGGNVAAAEGEGQNCRAAHNGGDAMATPLQAGAALGEAVLDAAVLADAPVSGAGAGEPARAQACAGRDAITRDVCRGAGRLLRAMSFAVLNELVLPNGRRADVVGLSPSGAIWIVEVKSCVDDFRVDQKWPEYMEFADALFFAVSPQFPHQLLPAETGLILADRYGGEIVRNAPEDRLAAARRKAMTLRFARAAAFGLQTLADPDIERA